MLSMLVALLVPLLPRRIRDGQNSLDGAKVSFTSIRSTSQTPASKDLETGRRTSLGGEVIALTPFHDRRDTDMVDEKGYVFDGSDMDDTPEEGSKFRESSINAGRRFDAGAEGAPEDVTSNIEPSRLLQP
jgi:hypothetical protein